MIFLESTISQTAVFVLAYCRTQLNSTLQYLQLAPMNIHKKEKVNNKREEQITVFFLQQGYIIHIKRIAKHAHISC